MAGGQAIRIDTEWHEAPSVTIARMVCQLILSVGLLSVCLWLSLAHPEYHGVAGLVAGTVLGAWFNVVRAPHR